MRRSQPKNQETSPEVFSERRSNARHKLVLRVGLLEMESGSTFCLVKNISSTGVQVKPYGPLKTGVSAALRVGDERAIEGIVVWNRDGLAGIEFTQTLNPQALLRIGQKILSDKRRTSPRVATDLGATLRTGGRRHSVTVCDLSMVGARIRASEPILFGENTLIELAGIPSLKAFVRWSEDTEHGVSFQIALPIQILADLIAEDRPLRVF